MECTVPVQYIGPGHSAPRDQCRGNTLPYYRSSSFGNSFHCKKMFKVRVFTQINISKRSFLLRSILMLFPSCIEESGSKCGDRFVCCQSFSRRVEERQKEAHTKLEEKHPQFWRILENIQRAGFAEEFPFGCRQDRLRCLIDGIGKFVSSAKESLMWLWWIRWLYRKRNEIWAEDLGSWLIYNCPATSSGFSFWPGPR